MNANWYANRAVHIRRIHGQMSIKIIRAVIDSQGETPFLKIMCVCFLLLKYHNWHSYRNLMLFARESTIMDEPTNIDGQIIWKITCLALVTSAIMTWTRMHVSEKSQID